MRWQSWLTLISSVDHLAAEIEQHLILNLFELRVLRVDHLVWVRVSVIISLQSAHLAIDDTDALVSLDLGWRLAELSHGLAGGPRPRQKI